MLSFSKAQMDGFDAQAWDAFRAELASHLETFYPWCKSHWPDGSGRALADFGCERAQFYGFRTERQVTMFVNLMPVLGSRYDENPLLPWAAAKLADPKLREPVHRIDQLCDLAMLHLRKTNGRGGRKAYKGLKAVHAALEQNAPPADAPAALIAAFPDRARAAPATREVLSKAVDHAAAFGMQDDMGKFLCATLTLFFGPYFYADPQMPRINAILYDKTASASQKTDALRQEVLSMMAALRAHTNPEED